MSQYIEKIQQHPLINSIDIFKSNIADIDEFDDLQTDELEIINRIKAVVSFSEIRILNTDPFLIPINSLNNINTALTSINNEINNFKARRNIAHLNNSNNFIDNILIHISNVCTPLNVSEIENIRESIISFRKSIGQQLRHIDSEYNALNDSSNNLKINVNSINNIIETQKVALNDLIEKFKDDFTNSENDRNKHYQTNFEELKTELNEEIDNISNQFDDFTKNINDQFDKTKILFREEVDTFISSLELLKNQAENIVGVIGNTGIVGGFQQFADKERRAAFWWKIIALFSFSGLITFGILSFIITVGTSFSWGILGARLFAASTFGILAAYAARLADKHDFSEKLNRKMELELASIDPYIINLPDDLRNDIKKQLSDKLFGQYDVLKSHKEEKVSKNSFDLIKTTLDVLKEAIKKLQ